MCCDKTMVLGWGTLVCRENVERLLPQVITAFFREQSACNGRPATCGLRRSCFDLRVRRDATMRTAPRAALAAYRGHDARPQGDFLPPSIPFAFHLWSEDCGPISCRRRGRAGAGRGGGGTDPRNGHWRAPTQGPGTAAGADPRTGRTCPRGGRRAGASCLRHNGCCRA